MISCILLASIELFIQKFTAIAGLIYLRVIMISYKLNFLIPELNIDLKYNDRFLRNLSGQFLFYSLRVYARIRQLKGSCQQKYFFFIFPKCLSLGISHRLLSCRLRRWFRTLIKQRRYLTNYSP